MTSYVIAWPTLGIAILVFGFAPGAVLRLILILYPKDNPRRRELIGELYAVPRIERPFWVAEQFEIAIFEGLRSRVKAWFNMLPIFLARRSEGIIQDIQMKATSELAAKMSKARTDLDAEQLLLPKIVSDQMTKDRYQPNA